MERDKIIKLTNALYAVTDLFPEKESLKFSIREKGNSVLSLFIILKNQELVLNQEEVNKFKIQVKREILTLFSYFELAEKQKWVHVRNFKILKKQYSEVLKRISLVKGKQIKKNNNKSKNTKKEVNFNLTEMQERLLTIMQDNGKIRPSDLKVFFPDINPRSIRRELRDLKERGIINSEGKGRGTSYEINSLY